MTALEARDFAQKALPLGWRCRFVPGGGSANVLPYWAIVSPGGELRSLMGLHRMTETEITNRVKGLVTRMHYRGK